MIGKKFNYGWVIVGYGVLCMLLLHYGTVGSQAIFLLPVTQDLGVSTTTLTMASTYGTIVSMIVTPWAGKLMDKKSIRRLMFFGILGTGLTMVAQSYVTSVYTYYAIILVRTALNPFALMMPFAALAARWFTKENRSFATSIIFVGISLGGVLLSNPLAALIETVVLLSKGEIDSKKVRVEFSLEDMDMSGFQKGATYEQIKTYVLEHSGLKVSSLYISQVKRKCGLDVGQNYNLSKKEDAKVPQCPPEKERAIRDALKFFHLI